MPVVRLTNLSISDHILHPFFFFYLVLLNPFLENVLEWHNMQCKSYGKREHIMKDNITPRYESFFGFLIYILEEMKS